MAHFLFIHKRVSLNLLQSKLSLNNIRGSRFLKQWCLQTFVCPQVPLRLHLDEIIHQLLLRPDSQILVYLYLIKNALWARLSKAFLSFRFIYYRHYFLKLLSAIEQLFLLQDQVRLLKLSIRLHIRNFPPLFRSEAIVFDIFLRIIRLVEFQVRCYVVWLSTANTSKAHNIDFAWRIIKEAALRIISFLKLIPTFHTHFSDL